MGITKKEEIMSICYRTEERVFQLDTPGSSYLMGLVDEEGFVGHIYYGRKLGGDDLRYLLRTEERPFVPGKNNRERNAFLDSFPMEYPGSGSGDYREGAIEVRTRGGHQVVMPLYRSHKIYPGKPELPGLPATFGGEEDCDTLELVLWDQVLKLEAVLYYTAFRKLDVITRSVRVRNQGGEAAEMPGGSGEAEHRFHPGGILPSGAPLPGTGGEGLQPEAGGGIRIEFCVFR